MHNANMQCTTHKLAMHIIVKVYAELGSGGLGLGWSCAPCKLETCNSQTCNAQHNQDLC